MTDGYHDDQVERQLRSYLQRMSSYPRSERAGRATSGSRRLVRAAGVLAAVAVAVAVVVAGLALHQARVPGGSAPASTGPGTSAPSPTPGSGRGRIAFHLAFGSTGSDCNIATIEPNGTGLRMLTNAPTGSGCDGDPAWTRTGDQILFDIGSDTSSHLFSIRAAGGSIRQLTYGPSYDGDPAVSPDGRLIAFDRSGGPNPPLSGIFLMNADGSHIVRVTTPPASSTGGDVQPDFSPDGTKVAFMRDGAIYVIGTDGTGLHQVAPASLDAIRPRWSPDGSKLLFSNDPNSANATADHNIHVVNADGTGLRALTAETGQDWAAYPAWSPDGAEIIFSRFHNGTYFVGLVVMQADGSNPTLIWNPTPGTNTFPRNPAWGTAP